MNEVPVIKILIISLFFGGMSAAIILALWQSWKEEKEFNKKYNIKDKKND